MIVKVEAKVLKSALRIAKLCIGNKDGISSNFLFRYKDGRTEILSKSTRVFSLCPFVSEVEVSDDTAFTVEAWRMIQWVNCLEDKSQITLSYKEGSVTAKSGRSKVKFRSLDPNGFRGWDSLFDSSEECCDISPPVMASAISAGKLFVSQEDTFKPENCQLVAWGDFLASTNGGGVCNVGTPYEGVEFRIPFKDISTVLKFIEDSDTVENKVTLRSSKRPVEEGGAEFDFFVRPDGTYIGVSRLAIKPGKFMAPEKGHDVHATISINNGELQKALSFLKSSAPKGHHSVKFSTSEGVVTISMPSAAGGDDSYPLDLTKSTGEDLEFFLDHQYVASLFGLFGLNLMDMGVVKAGNKGYVTFHHEDPSADKNTYSVAVLCHF